MENPCSQSILLDLLLATLFPDSAWTAFSAPQKHIWQAGRM